MSQKNSFPRCVLLLAVGVLVSIGASGCSAEARKARRLAHAQAHVEAQAFEKAEIEFLNVLQIDPLQADAIAGLAIIYSDQGRLGRVFPFLSKARELQPDNLEVRIRLAKLYSAVGRFNDAREELLFVLGRRPQDPEAPVLLAETAMQPAEIAEARRRLQDLQGSSAASVAVALGMLDLRERKYSEAEAAFERARSLDPKFSTASFALGTLHWTRGDTARAEAELAKAASLAPMRSAQRIRFAQFLQQAGKPDAARAALEEITTAVPDYLPARLMLAELAASRKDFDASLSDVGYVLARDAAHPDALLLGARVLLAQGESGKAVIELERAVKMYPRSAPMHHQLAVSYLSAGDVVKAVSSLNEAIALAPGSASSIMLLAEINLRQGNAHAATTALQQLVQQQPRLEQARLLLAHAYRVQRKFDDALAVYRELEKLTPGNPQTWLLMGMVLRQQEKPAEARQAFNHALEVAPDFLPATELLVNLDLETKDFAAAKARINAQLVRNPDAPGANLILAKVQIAEGDTQAAEGTLLKVIRQQPELPMPYFLLARLYLTSNQQDKALANLEQAVAANPKSAESLMMIGVIHDQRKDYAAARDAYEKLLAINPRFSAALNNLAYLYSEHLNDLDRAYEMAQRARELLPREPHTADTLGWILHKRGQYAWALSLLTESAGRLPDSAEVQYHLGMTHYMMGDEQAARTALERAVSLGDGLREIEEARRSLSLLALDPSAAGPEAKAMLEKMVAARPDPVALIRLGSLYERSGEVERATSAYEAALAASPNNVRAAVGLVRLYRSQQQFAKALELAKTTRKLAPDDPDVAQSLGRLAFESGDHVWALSLLQEAARKKPRDPDTLFELAEAAYSVGQLSAAEKAMREALELNSGFSRAAAARRFLEMLSWSGSTASASTAAAEIERALEQNANAVPALMAAGTLHVQRRDFAAAKRTFEKVLSQYPGFSPAKRQLVLLSVSAPGDAQKERALALEAREAFPDDAEVAKAAGIIMLRQKNYPRALNLLQESSRTNSTDAELMYYLGVTQHQLEDRVASRRSLQRALELGLSSDLATEAERLIAGMN